MKLEIGSGERPTPGYYHQDVKHFPSNDFTGPVISVNLYEELEEVIAIGVIEHLRYEEVKQLFEWILKKIKPGGIFIFDAPDMRYWIKYAYDMINGYEVPFEPKHIWSTIYGWQRWEGDEHKSGWTDDMIFELIDPLEYQNPRWRVEMCGQEVVKEIRSRGIERNRFGREEDKHLYYLLTKEEY